ncbi:carbonic anhydrase [Weissella uvarum]|uniref:carbonic anhydrase family protein n=1 Tax=Weissella uvarum TaxID=1479233 RepID=UPI00195FAD44|nr:carbonic anhydrase family protein [Weissella uvarum]MBM7617812.1 carbonic anhydrase [Weissella uvarum]MCM0595809.1 carbonic anhydrase family protein [Weissella uvarum]
MPNLDYIDQDHWSFVSGQHQSPVALAHQAATADPELADLEMHYDAQIRYVRDTGASLEFGLSGTARLNHRQFEVEQAHIHTPAEHTIDNHQAPAELHFVHHARDGQLAVIAVPIELADTNPAMMTILDAFPTQEAFELSIAPLIPEKRTYLHYLGSLTTPPLTENVEWYVLDHPIQIDKDQLEVLHHFHNGNNRQLQPLNDRIIEYHQD